MNGKIVLGFSVLTFLIAGYSAADQKVQNTPPSTLAAENASEGLFPGMNSSRPPTFPTPFTIPPAAPTWPFPASITEAQNGPSELAAKPRAIDNSVTIARGVVRVVPT